MNTVLMSERSMEFKATVKTQSYTFKGLRVLAPNTHSSGTGSVTPIGQPSTPTKSNNTSLQFQRPSQRYTTQPPNQSSQPRPTTSVYHLFDSVPTKTIGNAAPRSRFTARPTCPAPLEQLPRPSTACRSSRLHSSRRASP